MAFTPAGASSFQIDDAGRVYTLAPEKQRLLVALTASQTILVAAHAIYLVLALHRLWIPLVLAVAASLIGGGYLVSIILTSATVLYRDRIELRTLYTRQILRKADIASQSFGATPKGGKFIELTPRQSNLKPMKVPRREGDAGFSLWFRDIPVREAQLTPRQRARAAPVDPIFAQDGVDPAVRRTQVRTVARALSILSFIVFGWELLWHRPYVLAVGTVILLPLVALAVVSWSNGLIALTIRKGDPRPHMIAPLFAGLVLMGVPTGVPNDYGHAPWLPVVEVAIGLALFGGIWRLDPLSRKNWLGLAGIALLCLLYGKGAFEVLNRIADTAPAQPARAPLMSTPQARGIGRYRKVTIFAQPWAGSRGSLIYSMTPAAYARTVQGRSVCVGVHSGALGLRWADVRPCA